MVGLWVLLSLTLFIGMIIFTRYQQCDPISNKQVNTGEQVTKKRNKIHFFKFKKYLNYLI
jgi:hypothetical protein